VADLALQARNLSVTDARRGVQLDQGVFAALALSLALFERAEECRQVPADGDRRGKVGQLRTGRLANSVPETASSTNTQSSGTVQPLRPA
jgi:hypothetical protein